MMRPSEYHQLRGAAGREGLSLVEVTVAMSLFAILILSVAMTLVRGVQYRRQTFQEYMGLSALRDVVAEIQEVANLPQSLALKQGIGAVYSRYHGQIRSVATLPSGTVTVTCFPNEAAVPATLGGSQDLNFDGDALDNLGNQSAGTDLKLIPMTLALTYVDDQGARSVSIQRLITKTTN